MFKTKPVSLPVCTNIRKYYIITDFTCQVFKVIFSRRFQNSAHNIQIFKITDLISAVMRKKEKKSQKALLIDPEYAIIFICRMWRCVLFRTSVHNKEIMHKGEVLYE